MQTGGLPCSHQLADPAAPLDLAQARRTDLGAPGALGESTNLIRVIGGATAEIHAR